MMLLPFFLRKPTGREVEFLSYYHSAQKLLSSDELMQLRRYHTVGRIGYDLVSIFGILILKLYYHQRTMKDTLLLLEEHMNLRDILGIAQVPSETSMSRLSRTVEGTVSIGSLHERLIKTYTQGMQRVIGHLSIDSTTIEAREKPYRKNKEVPQHPEPPKKRGRKPIGSPERQEYLERLAQEQQSRLQNLQNSRLLNLNCAALLGAKQNSKGKRQWFIGYKAHIAADDFGVSISFAVTGVCVHDSKVAVFLLKLAHRETEFLYILLDIRIHQPCSEWVCRYNRA